MAIFSKSSLSLAIGCWLLTVTGCATITSCDWCKLYKQEPGPAVSKVSNILTYWDNRIRYAPDTLHNGTPLPGLAGRVLLTGEGEPGVQAAMDADGMIVVDLYDMRPLRAGGQPTMLERWQFDAETLKRLKKKDGWGDGYTLFLPWSTHRADITEVKLQLSYTPTAGSAQYADPMMVSLRPDDPIPIQNRTVTGAQPQAPAKK